MRRYLLAPAARHDIDSILLLSYEQFGEEARARYASLFAQAFLDLAAHPRRAGTVQRDELAHGVSTYHLAHSRDNVDRAAGRVKHPRHVLVFRHRAEDVIEILRVLHDHMDIARHLPEP